MITTISSHADLSVRNAETDELTSRLKSLIEQTGNLLPAQGPLSGFAFLNPLQGLEELPFEEGMMKGSRLFGCSPYLTEDAYRQRLASGRIVLEDIRSVLRTELGPDGDVPIKPSGTRFDMRQAMIQYPLRSAPAEELRWFIAETNALTQFSGETPDNVRKRFLEHSRHWVMREALSRPKDEASQEQMGNKLVIDVVDRFDGGAMESWDETTWEKFSLHLLWHVCREGVEQVEIPSPKPTHYVRPRELFLQALGADSDLLVHPVLIRFCAAFTDQGISDWTLPDRDQGLFRSFCTLYKTPSLLSERWLRSLSREIARIETSGVTATESIRESLQELGVNESEWPEFLESTVLALRGWAGMIWQMEVREDRVPKPAPRGSLVEYVAVYLLLERAALKHLLQTTSSGREKTLASMCHLLREQRRLRSESTGEQRTFYVFQLAQVMGWTPSELYALTPAEWAGLIGEIECFAPLARRRIFQLAFEHRLLVKTLACGQTLRGLFRVLSERLSSERQRRNRNRYDFRERTVSERHRCRNPAARRKRPNPRVRPHPATDPAFPIRGQGNRQTGLSRHAHDRLVEEFLEIFGH